MNSFIPKSNLETRMKARKAVKSEVLTEHNIQPLIKSVFICLPVRLGGCKSAADIMLTSIITVGNYFKNCYYQSDPVTAGLEPFKANGD